jgi:transposase
MTSSPKTLIARFVAIDLHKSYVMVGAVDAQQTVVLSPRRLSLSEFADWHAKHLLPSDAVVFEATANAWTLYDQLVSQVGSVSVAHPLLVKLITAARVKTDRQDTLKLARLLAAGLIPAVWVPPIAVRELRGLVGHRRRLVNLRTQARNRLHGALHRHNLMPPGNGLFALHRRSWWLDLDLSSVEKLRVRQDLQLLDHLEPLLNEVEAEVCRLSTTEPWADQVPFLIQLPGIGVLTAMILLSAIGEIQRFPSAKQLVGYSGLGASVHASGQTYYTGGITKQGRHEIRSVMVEASWMAVEHSAYWHQKFDALATRIGRQKAIAAIARKLLVVVWHVLTVHQADRHGNVEATARKFMTWGTQQRTARRAGLSRSAFVRKQLDHWGIGQDLQTLNYAGQSYALPSSG